MARAQRTTTKAFQERLRRVDDNDRQTILDAVTPPDVRCAGGRLVLPEGACLHCGSPNPQEACAESAVELLRRQDEDRAKLQTFKI